MKAELLFDCKRLLLWISVWLLAVPPASLYAQASDTFSASVAGLAGLDVSREYLYAMRQPNFDSRCRDVESDEVIDCTGRNNITIRYFLKDRHVSRLSLKASWKQLQLTGFFDGSPDTKPVARFDQDYRPLIGRPAIYSQLHDVALYRSSSDHFGIAYSDGAEIVFHAYLSQIDFLKDNDVFMGKIRGSTLICPSEEKQCSGDPLYDFLNCSFAQRMGSGCNPRP